jgi:hypothetical protein
MPTLHSHTHCQVAPAGTQAKTWRQRVSVPPHQRQRNPRQTRRAAANRRLAQWRVKWINEYSTSHQLLWSNDSFVLRNPPLRQAPKRFRLSAASPRRGIIFARHGTQIPK